MVIPDISEPAETILGRLGYEYDLELTEGAGMGRTRASAKKAGTAFETSIAGYLAEHVDDRIERRAKTGAKDRGDIGGVRLHGHRLVLECKNTAKTMLGPWAAEAEIERGNDDALAGLVVHKRHGKGQPGDQWVTMTVADLVAILTLSRDHQNAL